MSPVARPLLRLVHSLQPPPAAGPHQRAADRQWLAVRGAWYDGHSQGERQGYRAGWRWGLVCGASAAVALALAGAGALALLGLLP